MEPTSRQVLTYEQSAGRGSISVRHLARLLAAGEGPPVVKLGVRRRGIFADDLEVWLLARRGPTLGRATTA
jgi:hypothetical protein